MKVLSIIKYNKSENPINHKTAAGFRGKLLDKFEFVFMVVLRTTLLERFDKTIEHLYSL